MSWMKGLKKNKQLTLGHPLQDGGKVLSGAKGKNVAAFQDPPDSIGGYLVIKAEALAEAHEHCQGLPYLQQWRDRELRSTEQMPAM